MCSDRVVSASSLLGNNAVGFSSPQQQSLQNSGVAPFTNFHQFQNTLFGQNFGLNKMNFPQTLQQLTGAAATSNSINPQNNQQSTATAALLPLTSTAQNATKFSVYILLTLLNKIIIFYAYFN